MLYLVTTLEKDQGINRAKRSPAIFTTFAKAREVVEGNIGDIFEYRYEYAVIEAMQADVLYPPLSPEYQQWWYGWVGDGETRKYVACDQPVEYCRVIGLGMG